MEKKGEIAAQAQLWFLLIQIHINAMRAEDLRAYCETSGPLWSPPIFFQGTLEELREQMAALRPDLVGKNTPLEPLLHKNYVGRCAQLGCQLLAASLVPWAEADMVAQFDIHPCHPRQNPTFLALQLELAPLPQMAE